MKINSIFLNLDPDLGLIFNESFNVNKQTKNKIRKQLYQPIALWLLVHYTVQLDVLPKLSLYTNSISAPTLLDAFNHVRSKEGIECRLELCEGGGSKRQ